MKKSPVFLILLFALNSYSQKEANIWYFGENAGLDFNTNPPSAITDGKINTLEGCSSFLTLMVTYYFIPMESLSGIKTTIY